MMTQAAVESVTELMARHAEQTSARLLAALVEDFSEDHEFLVQHQQACFNTASSDVLFVHGGFVTSCDDAEVEDIEIQWTFARVDCLFSVREASCQVDFNFQTSRTEPD
jgi:GTP:adenosylcobinamide-phosphate guanylyltransferase